MAIRARGFSVSVAVLFVIVASYCCALAENDLVYQGEFDRANVVLMVEGSSSFPGGRRVVVGVSCDGWLQVRGAYNDTTVIRVSVLPDSVIVLVNGLLGIDFLGQPAEYGCERGKLRPMESGRLSLGSERMIDGTQTRITLRLGTRAHSVTLKSPAWGAPASLLAWVEKFRLFVAGYVDWVRF
jgi:hypothetical protein